MYVEISGTNCYINPVNLTPTIHKKCIPCKTPISIYYAILGISNIGWLWVLILFLGDSYSFALA